jgi:hypothetical protein
MDGVFVGASRARIVDELIRAFDDCSPPRFAALVSPPGWGKTRIVQELYKRLAAHQPPPAYWPPSIVDVGSGMESLTLARKSVYPRSVIVPAGAEMPWMWWGILWPP